MGGLDIALGGLELAPRVHHRLAHLVARGLNHLILHKRRRHGQRGARDHTDREPLAQPLGPPAHIPKTQPARDQATVNHRQPPRAGSRRPVSQQPDGVLKTQVPPAHSVDQITQIKLGCFVLNSWNSNVTHEL